MNIRDSSYPSDWRWNKSNVMALETLLTAAVGTCGGDPVLRPEQTSLLARYLSNFGVLVPGTLTDEQANALPTWTGRGGDDEARFIQSAQEVRAELERIAKGEQ